MWRGGLNDDIKRRLFVATVESVLLYGADRTWTLTANQERALDSVYTRLLRMALDVHWEDHICQTPSSTLPYQEYLSRSENEE